MKLMNFNEDEGKKSKKKKKKLKRSFSDQSLDK
jgi:hypothetical protein